MESEQQSNTYRFSLLNQRRHVAIRKVHCLVIFKDENEKPIHLDFVEFSEEIPAGEKREITRLSIFDILSKEEESDDYDSEDIVLAAVVFGSRGWDPNAYSLVTPEIKRLTKTYEVRVVNFEVVE